MEELTMAKNPFGKMTTTDKPHAVFEDAPSRTIWKILKTYQLPKNEAGNKYAKWFVECNGDMGDTYISGILKSGVLREASPEWIEAYRDVEFRFTGDPLAELFA